MSFAQGSIFVLLNLIFLPFMAHRMNHRWWVYLIRGALIGVGLLIPVDIMSSLDVAKDGSTLWIVLDVIGIGVMFLRVASKRI